MENHQDYVFHSVSQSLKISEIAFSGMFVFVCKCATVMPHLSPLLIHCLFTSSINSASCLVQNDHVLFIALKQILQEYHQSCDYGISLPVPVQSSINLGKERKRLRLNQAGGVGSETGEHLVRNWYSEVFTTVCCEGKTLICAKQHV